MAPRRGLHAEAVHLHSSSERRPSYTNLAEDKASTETSPLPPNPVDEAVAFTLVMLRSTTAMWFFGIFMVCVKASAFDSNQLLARQSWYLTLGPVWLGNLLFAYLQFNLILRVVLCFGRGRVLSESDYRILPRASNANIDLAHSISEEQTLVVTRAVGGVVLSVPVLLLVTASQILMCGYLETGHPNTWICAAPLIAIQIVALLQVLLLKNSVKASAVHVLIFALTFSVCAHLEQSKSLKNSWLTVLWPLWALNTVFMAHVTTVLFRALSGRYELKVQQLLCGGLYIVGIILATTGESLLAMFPPSATDDPFVSLYVPLSSIFFGILISGLSFLVAIHEHAQWLSETRGFADPIPLIFTDDGGWEPSGDGDENHDLLFGGLGTEISPVPAAPRTGVELSTVDVVSSMDEYVTAPAINSDNYDSGCDSAAFNDIYGGNTTGASGAEEST